jgi:prolipoprotein diacylglyceryltransferase
MTALAININLTLSEFANLDANKYYLIGIPLVFIVNRLLAFKYRTSKLQTFFYSAAMIVFGFIGSHWGADIYNWFQKQKGNETMFTRTVFGTILTVVIVTFVLVMLEKGVRLLIGKLRKKPVKSVLLRDVYDAIQPGALILIVFTKFRCLYVGCCHGIPWSWGLYSKKIDTIVFPVQIVEACMTFSILILVWYLSQKRFFRRGMALFMGGGLFCFGRFFLEFLMYYVPEDRTCLGHLTLLQCACILIFVICIGVIVYLYKTYPPDPLPGKLRPIIEKREAIKAEKQKEKAPRKKQTVSQKKYSKQWQSTKKKYKKKK